VCPIVDCALLKKSPPWKDALRTSFEVYQLGKLTSIPTSRVHDVAFIFTMSYIEERHEDLVSIKNAYYMRFRKLSEDIIIEDIPPSNCLPFSSSYCEEHHHMCCLHSHLWNDGKTPRKFLVQAVNKKSPQNPAGPIGVSYSCEASSKLCWNFLKHQFSEKVEVVENNKRKLKVVNMIRYLRQDAYHEPRPVESLTFNMTENIGCLRTALGNMIGFSMAYVPAINQHRYLGENDNCLLFICSESYVEELMHPKHLQDVDIRFT
jgi:hypothetical protein